ncbi:MAG TPA: dynamin family protein, partial [Labilithrix sp.]|nr:dynamin family protein [Labilithrix sp.]
MSDREPHIDRLLAWYTTKARPFLEQHAPLSLESIDKRKSDVEKLSRSVDDEVAVCFLGDAGVGKSTLLNAIVSASVNVLPHGGIGPLTAQATVVRYAETPYFRATYLSAAALNRILFALARTHESALKRAERTSLSAELGEKLDEEDRRDAESALPVQEADTPAESGKLDAYKRQIRLLIQGSQEGDVDLPYLIDGLCTALGYKSRFGLTPKGEDATRIERIRQCLRVAAGEGVHRERREDGDRKGFLAELREHASGFLAPLIKNLEVGWNGEALQGGLVLVDLPGVGVANDEYRKVTSEWVRTRAQAVVLVVHSRGVTEASVELLRSTGFLARMLHDSHDPSAKLASLSVAVVKVDEIADSDWQQERSLDPETARKWNVHFRDNCERAVGFVQQQMRTQLDKLVADGPQATLDERREAVSRILETMQVHAVSAPQYRQFKRDDEEMPARIKSAEESRLPELVASLLKVAQDHRGLRKERAKAALTDFQKRVLTVIDLVRAQWEENARAEKEAQELREELETFLAPKQRELDARQGAFREFLRESIPTQIETRVEA